MDESLLVKMEQVLDTIPVDDGGGASRLKMLVLADLIIARPVIRMVEIGVYRGRLLLPLAMLMQWREGGEVFGIDPYAALAAEQHDEHHRQIDLEHWADEVDWDDLYEGVQRTADQLGLQTRCNLVRARSEDVADQFAPGTIDLLHIDGNHDRDAVARDAELYVPRVSVGGYVVLDDASWPSVHPVFEQMYAEHDLIFQLSDIKGIGVDDNAGNDFAVFRLRGEGSPERWTTAF
ncbi:MAG: class I SAM-dependent methyltransferase [Solirubrobacterales bacterium]